MIELKFDKNIGLLHDHLSVFHIVSRRM